MLTGWNHDLCTNHINTSLVQICHSITLVTNTVLQWMQLFKSDKNFCHVRSVSIKDCAVSNMTLAATCCLFFTLSQSLSSTTPVALSACC